MNFRYLPNERVEILTDLGYHYAIVYNCIKAWIQDGIVYAQNKVGRLYKFK